MRGSPSGMCEDVIKVSSLKNIDICDVKKEACSKLLDSLKSSTFRLTMAFKS